MIKGIREIKPDDVRIKLQCTKHDINIVDTEHEDNSITITRVEAKWLLEVLAVELAFD